MWLIDAKALRLENFSSRDVPLYVILSHRWVGEETTFQEFQRSYDDATAGDEVRKIKSKAGYKKIKNFCQLAIAEGVQYAWVDTCCIDKSSSAELSEAINSMYRWYYKSHKCFVYLDDTAEIHVPEGRQSMVSPYAGSKWFTRGWTLQELLAPESVHFYDSDWNHLGTKASEVELLEAVTGVPREALENRDSIQNHSVACRMSWAAHRITSRKEDIAYSLMGLFDVCMPMLYGEGERAFIRLQEEILKISGDHSIFAWRDHAVDKEMCGGLLARSPACFENSGDVVPVPGWRSGSRVVTQTNMGLKLELPMIETQMIGERTNIMAFLSCRRQSSAVPAARLCIRLTCLDITEAQFGRIEMGFLSGADQRNAAVREVYIRQVNIAPSKGRDAPSIPQTFRFKMGYTQFTRGKLGRTQKLQPQKDYACWLATESDIWRLCPGSARLKRKQPKWTQIESAIAMRLNEDSEAEKQPPLTKPEEKTAAITLSSFLNTPATLLRLGEDNWLLIGRGLHGGLGVQEVSRDLAYSLMVYGMSTNLARQIELMDLDISDKMVVWNRASVTVSASVLKSVESGLDVFVVHLQMMEYKGRGRDDSSGDEYDSESEDDDSSSSSSS